AHPLKPVVHVGKEGLTDAVIRSVEEALHTRELLKVKVLEGAQEDPRTVAHTLAERIENVTVVQVMGRIATLHRPKPDAERA
ncbi:MAG: YhbY family RNA-binding protein, partial [Rhodothermales bacterium]|nr:YhbY family RNA-binding protein [Rhodothermales bacterium]